MELLDKNGKRVKKGGAFVYTNQLGKTKAFVYHKHVPHPTTPNLNVVYCHYVDDPTKIVHRSMYTEQVVYITRMNKVYRIFKSRFLKSRNQ